MSVRQMLRLLELEKGVKLGCLPFTEIDVRNLLQCFRNVDRDTDAIDLIAMCKKLKDENPNFKYDFRILHGPMHPLSNCMKCLEMLWFLTQPTDLTPMICFSVFGLVWTIMELLASLVVCFCGMKLCDRFAGH